ncbi:MAG: SPFH domain-containing protein, partial [Victivallales bacterium]|nr:SPFH domain-containing protein [Victivallales bacterium]
GESKIVAQSGQKFYISLTHRLYVLDRTLQTLEMTVTAGRGERPGKDDIKIKTVDGSDVHVDVVVQYRIMPDKADLVLATSGPGELYKQKWARDFVRTQVRNHLGTLTTEDFYDATMRSEQIASAVDDASAILEPYGLKVDSIILPHRPRFYAEYEAAIKKKKLADQQAQQEESKALAAIQKKNTEEVTATNKKNVAVEQYEGDVERLIIQAEADAGKVRLEADAYFERISIGAEAALYQKTKEAEGILATKRAEAEGIEALGQALAGEGGRNMVKLEYAKRLQGVTITGQPYVTESTTSRFAHTAAATTPAATGGKAK